MTPADKANSRFLRIIARSDEYRMDLDEHDPTSLHPSEADLRAFVQERLPESQMEEIEEAIVNSERLFQAYLGLRIEEAAYEQNSAQDDVRHAAKRAFIDAGSPLTSSQSPLAERVWTRIAGLFGNFQLVPATGALATVAILLLVFAIQNVDRQPSIMAELYIAAETDDSGRLVIRGGGNSEGDNRVKFYPVPNRDSGEQFDFSVHTILATQELVSLLQNGLSNTGALEASALFEAVETQMPKGTDKIETTPSLAVVLSQPLAFDLRQNTNLAGSELEVEMIKPLETQNVDLVEEQVIVLLIRKKS
ncbi:hypothetical protein [Ruegeria arenilitoris]|uniref:hypothetical protein n=1 Tax=Ruegeria arenilitoris TaxID=1173585 RepID=UPI001C972DE1|nr:hypothetical protein [Ruegeria arenilitoris]MBY6082059.1 hypothetical protein [Ruegeria arenilitoris]